MGTAGIDRQYSFPELVGYQGYSSFSSTTADPNPAGKWDAVIEFDATIDSKDVSFFYPYTTTFVELRMNREPMPLQGVNRVFWFGEQQQ